MNMLIDGQWVSSSDGMIRVVRNPGHGRPDRHRSRGKRRGRGPRAPCGGRRRAAHARSAGAQALGNPPRRRGCHSRPQRTSWRELLARENGKPIRQTRDEVEVTSRIFRGFAEEARRIFGRTIPKDAVPGNERHFALTVRQPLGVVAAIVPFNYPVELYAHKAAPRLPRATR